MPTIEQVKVAIQAADDADLPDAAWFQFIHDFLGVEVGDINDLIAEASWEMHGDG